MHFNWVVVVVLHGFMYDFYGQPVFFQPQVFREMADCTRELHKLEKEFAKQEILSQVALTCSIIDVRGKDDD